jgi:hypothetical protein
VAFQGRKIDRSFLGEAVLRLSRVFGLSGEVSPQFDAGDQITPVVVVADATGPGYRGQNLRGWAYGEKVGAVVANTSKLGIKATAPGGIIIDGFTIGTGTVPVAPTEWCIGILGSADPDPFAMVATNVRYTERLIQANGDIAPLAVGAQNADALQYGAIIAQGSLPIHATVVLPIPVFLVSGAKVIMQGVNVTGHAMHFSAWGRVL